ncbi:MAG: hypothetical protein AAF436_12995 [Myxococcota bacterium]
MRRLSTVTLVAATLALTAVAAAPHATANRRNKAEQDYVPASSGKRYTPINGPELRVIAGALVGVPIFLDNDRDVVRPGGEMSAWVGLDIGWLVFSGIFGASWTPIDLGAVDGGEGFGRNPLSRIFISPEVRIQVPAKAAIPYISGTFDANWWRHRDPQGLDCGIWYCERRTRFSFAPGFTGKAGLAIRVGERIYLDAGMKASLTGAGSFFDSSEWWLTPFLGITYRGDPD